MRTRVLKFVKRAALLLATILITLIGVRIYDTQRGLPLELWHIYAPSEMSADEIDHADWGQYLAAEQAVFDDVRAEVTAKLDPSERVPVNRYFEGSPVYPGRFAQDWNRSYVLEPEGDPVGAVVFLHGLTTRLTACVTSRAAIARTAMSRSRSGCRATVPSRADFPTSNGKTGWPPPGWRCARRAGGSGRRRPLHLVGFSNGGALAMKYALDALEDPQLTRPIAWS